MALRAEEISSIIQKEITEFGQPVRTVNVGTVVEIGDGIARVYGLAGAMSSELLEFETTGKQGGPSTVMGMALNLEEESVGSVILGPYTGIEEGATVRTTGRIVEVPVGDGMVAQVVNALDEFGAMEHTIVVAATAAEPAALQYIAPYSGCAMGEEFMESGRDALIVYDDLSKHAWSYRQVSLLLRRPPGREAYPGDVFYLHSRLLERAARMSEQRGGGSLTALPIIETQANDVSAYIPTNVISITDGQIFLEPDLFYAGIRPALNVGISVSRVGGDAQIKAYRQVAGKLKLDMAQFRDLAAFAQFGSDLDKATRAQLDKGLRIQEVLKQPQYSPLPVAQQIAILYAVTNGYLDDVAIENIGSWEQQFHEFMRNAHKDILDTIVRDKVLSDQTIAALQNAIVEFKKTVTF